MQNKMEGQNKDFKNGDGVRLCFHLIEKHDIINKFKQIPSSIAFTPGSTFSILSASNISEKEVYLQTSCSKVSYILPNIRGRDEVHESTIT